MPVYEIIYRNTSGLFNLVTKTKISSNHFILKRNWIFFREDDDDLTVKFAVQADDVLSIQDLGDEVVEND